MDDTEDSLAYRLLIADDDESFSRILKRTLEVRGHEAVVANTQAEAISFASGVLFDGAVVDLRLGESSGLVALKELFALRPSMKIVLLTGYGSIATAVEATKLGAVNYLSKPAGVDEILGALFGQRTADEREGQGYTVQSLARVEWEHICRVLHSCGGNVSEAARKLGMHRRSLQRKLQKYPPLE